MTWVALVSDDQRLRALAMLGDEPPKLSDGYGGWQPIAVPRDTAFLEWQGSNPFTLIMPVVMSGWLQQASIEAFLSQVEKMGQKQRGALQPPELKLDGPALGWITTQPWVLNNIEWGKVLRNGAGQRSHAEMTLTFLQKVDPSILVKKAKKKAAKVRYYRVKKTKNGKPETLQAIAKKLLKKASRYKEIMKLNHIRDPRKIKVGQKLKIPLK